MVNMHSIFITLNIIETKLINEPKEVFKKSIHKSRCILTFKSKAFDFLSLPEILRSKEVCNNLPSKFDNSDIPISFPLLDRLFLTISNLYFI